MHTHTSWRCPSGSNFDSRVCTRTHTDNHFLDDQGFTPFGELASDEDLEVFKHNINAEYGEKADQNKIIYDGNQLYLNKAFPHMSYIKTESVTVLEP